MEGDEAAEWDTLSSGCGGGRQRGGGRMRRLCKLAHSSKQITGWGHVLLLADRLRLQATTALWRLCARVPARPALTSRVFCSEGTFIRPRGPGEPGEPCGWCPAPPGDMAPYSLLFLAALCCVRLSAANVLSLSACGGSGGTEARGDRQENVVGTAAGTGMHDRRVALAREAGVVVRPGRCPGARTTWRVARSCAAPLAPCHAHLRGPVAAHRAASPAQGRPHVVVAAAAVVLPPCRG